MKINEKALKPSSKNHHQFLSRILGYNIPIANENLLPVGQYTGLVKVLDQRPLLLPEDNRDILIDTLDGVQLDKYEIPEYATYQTFTAIILAGCTEYCWTKTWGGTNSDFGNSVCLDAVGNAYVSGSYQETVDFNPDGGGTHTSNGLTDVFMSKFNSSGNWLWTKTWGGAEFDTAYSVSVDQAHNPYVTGIFTGTLDFNPDGSGTQSSNGLGDIFLSKFDSSGNWQWTKTWGGQNEDFGTSVSLDQAGSALVVGLFWDTVDFNPDGGGTQSSIGSTDAFLSKFDSSGNWQWTKTWGGLSFETCISISLDQAGNVYTTGQFWETAEFNPNGGGDQTSNGNADVYLSKFDSFGDWQLTKTWGGIEDDLGYSVSVDHQSNAYVTGRFWETADFNPNSGDPHTSIGDADIFLWKGNY